LIKIGSLGDRAFADAMESYRDFIDVCKVAFTRSTKKHPVRRSHWLIVL